MRLYTHCRYISIHAPSRERLKHNIRRLSCKNFNPRSLAGATCRSHRQTSLQEFQSTLPRGSDTNLGKIHVFPSISIHAPSRERLEMQHKNNRNYYFNPRSLAGATGDSRADHDGRIYFNPRSLAGATFRADCWCKPPTISIHAPSRERRESTVIWDEDSAISIHAPSRERPNGAPMHHRRYDFNPRSLAGATAWAKAENVKVWISIHAPSRERQLGGGENA